LRRRQPTITGQGSVFTYSRDTNRWLKIRTARKYYKKQARAEVLSPGQLRDKDGRMNPEKDAGVSSNPVGNEELRNCFDQRLGGATVASGMPSWVPLTVRLLT